jgi:hypothetical protein
MLTPISTLFASNAPFVAQFVATKAIVAATIEPATATIEPAKANSAVLSAGGRFRCSGAEGATGADVRGGTDGFLGAISASCGLGGHLKNDLPSTTSIILFRAPPRSRRAADSRSLESEKVVGQDGRSRPARRAPSWLRRGRDQRPPFRPEPHPQTKDPTLKTSATTAITVVTIRRPNVTVSYLSASSRFS